MSIVSRIANALSSPQLFKFFLDMHKMSAVSHNENMIGYVCCLSLVFDEVFANGYSISLLHSPYFSYFSFLRILLQRYFANCLFNFAFQFVKRRVVSPPTPCLLRQVSTSLLHPAICCCFVIFFFWSYILVSRCVWSPSCSSSMLIAGQQWCLSLSPISFGPCTSSVLCLLCILQFPSCRKYFDVTLCFSQVSEMPCSSSEVDPTYSIYSLIHFKEYSVYIPLPGSFGSHLPLPHVCWLPCLSLRKTLVICL